MNIDEMLEDEEGRKRCVYRDNLGFLTIGVGRLVDPRKPGAGLTDEEIDYLLANDIAAKTAEVRKALPWIDKLNEPRRAVLIGMAFQLGVAGLLGFHQTLALIATGQFDRAEDEMLQSLWAKQTPARAKRMAKQMATGQWQ